MASSISVAYQRFVFRPDIRPKSTEDEPLVGDWNAPRGARTASIKIGSGSLESSTNGDYRPETVLQARSLRMSEYSWTELILRHAKCGQGREALRIYEEMQKHGVEPRPRTFVALLQACSSLQDLESVKRINAEVIRHGFQSDLYVGTVLVDVYAKCRSLADARNAFEQMPRRDVVSWTAMILGYAQLGQGEEALQLYTQMQQEGMVPNDRTHVGALKACSSLARLEKGNEGVKQRCLETVRTIHADVRKGKFEADVFVGNMLVDVYARCGSLEDARQVFEKIPHPNVVSWNAMINGYVQMEEGEQALQLFAQMQKEGVIPNARTYVSILKACSRMAELEDKNRGDSIARRKRCLETASTIHAYILNGKCQLDVFVGTMLVDLYAKCGSLEDARQVFEMIPHRNVVSWNAMISGYAQTDSKEGLRLFARMQQEGVAPNGRTYVSVLKACSRSAELEEKNQCDCLATRESCLETVSAIHSDILNAKLETDVFVSNMLVDVYAKYGSLENARCVFENISHRDVVSWTTMIFGYAQMHMGEEGLLLFSRMQQEGVVPDCLTFLSVLKACCSMAESQEEIGAGCTVLRKRCLEKVRAVHADIVKRKFDSDVFVGNMLVDVYAKCGSLRDARRAFEKMPLRTVVAWNAIILGYAHMSEGNEALQLFDQMQQEGVAPDGWTYVSVLKACSSLAELEDSTESDGKCSEGRCLQIVRALHSDVVNRKLDSNGFVGNMLVDVYAKCRSLEDARSVFEKLPHRDVVSWTAIIFGYANMDRGEDALELFARMQQEGVTPSDQTYISALKACGSVAGLEKGKEIHTQISKAGLEAAHSFVASSLIDMYGKCGSMIDAQKVFDTSPMRDIVVWSALIGGYAHLGDSELVFHLFQRMTAEGIQPDGITYLAVLTACSHVGLVDRGQQYFEAMSRGGIKLTLKHFTCMVDLLGRAGQLDKAMEMVKTMPFQPRCAMWNCILAACKKWRNVDLGRQVFECSLRVDDNDAAAYVLMSNIYSAAHMWEEAKEIQAMRLKSRAWKQPGRSRWTDMFGVVHVFLAGDQGHPESEAIYAKIGDLLVKMKKAGYVAHLESVLRNMPNDEKEAALCGHSERLAIAYALLKTPEGTTIRVVKNLRVCEDCHRASALISRIEQRTIICRDTSRFHVFKDGKCSCRNFW